MGEGGTMCNWWFGNGKREKEVVMEEWQVWKTLQAKKKGMMKCNGKLEERGFSFGWWS